ncbi:hypothetical protein ABT279_21260, partial [Amycolatopsis sp. NPDC000673]
TVSDAAAGGKLPGLAVALAYVRACEGDADAWEKRWREVSARLAAEAEPPRETGQDPPYVGLAAFQASDAARFFGRETLVEDLTARVARQRFLAVFGASGVGKSSLLRAGLIAQVRAARPVVLITPGRHPIEECAVRLANLANDTAVSLQAELTTEPNALHLRVRQALADRPDDVDLLLVVDQFEEAFTLCADPAERSGFIELLLTAAQAPNSRTRVVLGVRTDFYTQCARHARLVEALRDAQLLVGPMSTDELRRAITLPASRAGYTVEGALLAAIAADSAGQAGALPLVSHALLETWRRRRGTTLTLSGYDAVGGIRHALAHTAEAVYGSLDPAQQQLAKHLLLRLTALGEDTDDTARRIARDELPSDDRDIDTVLEAFACARLILLDNNTVEISHEALITSWPRLGGWLAEDREGLRTHRRLTESAEAWISLGRDPTALYRGPRLAHARAWAESNGPALNTREEEFLTASATAEAENEAAHRRRARRTRQLLAALVLLAAATVTATVLAIRGQAPAPGPAPASAEDTDQPAPAAPTAPCDPRQDVVTIYTDHGNRCFAGSGTLAVVHEVQQVCAGSAPVSVLWSSGNVRNQTTAAEARKCLDFKDTPGDTWIHRIRIDRP